MTKLTKNTRKRITVKSLKEVPKDPSQKPIKSMFPTRKNLRKSLAKTYYPVCSHVYYDGHSFRVRVRTAGHTTSWNTPDKEEAIQYRDFLLTAKTLTLPKRKSAYYSQQ
jgi:hypothetical protein